MGWLADTGPWHLLALGVDAPAGQGRWVALGGQEGALVVTLRKVHAARWDPCFSGAVLEEVPLVLAGWGEKRGRGGLGVGSGCLGGVDMCVEEIGFL